MFYSLKLLANTANCNAQGKVEREEYIIVLIIIIIFVNEHDSVAKAFLKMGVKFFFFSFFLFPFKRENHQSGCPRERMDGEMFLLVWILVLRCTR